MKRVFATAIGMAFAGFTAQAQAPPPSNAGYLVIRVKLSGADGASGTGSGPTMPGAGGGPGYPGGSPMPGGLGGGPMPPGGFGPMPPGGAGFMPPGGGSPGPTAANADRSVFAVVPVKAVYSAVVYTGKPLTRNNPKHIWATHEYGKSLLFDDGSDVQVYSIPGTVEQDIKKKHADWAKDRKLDVLLDIIGYALATDHVDLAVAYSSELEKLYDPQKSAGPRVAQFVKAYQDIKAKLEEGLPSAPDAVEWQKRLKAVGIAEDKHYALLHWGEQSVAAETVNRRLTQLERNLKAFYLWHAVQGKALKFPDKKLIVVLANRPTDIDELRPKLDGAPVVSDAFYSPAHNLVVMSPVRLDDAGKSFTEIAKAKYQDGWNRDELLKGKAPVVKGENFSDLYRTMTYALVDRVLEEEATHAAITREASRQLYSTLGILPQHVILPKWIDNGISNLLYKPKDAGVVKVAGGKNGMAIGLWAGYGSPNYVLLREWRELWAKKELNAPPKELLHNVLTDRYFDATRTGIDPDPAPTAPAPGGNGGFAPPVGGGAAPPPPPAGGGGAVPPGGNSRHAPGAAGRGNPDAQGPLPPGAMPRPGGPMGPGGSGYPGGPMGPGGAGYPGSGIPGGGFGVIDSGPDKATIKAKLEMKAQVTSWALIYFLAKTNTPALHKFFADLDKLPRDMRIDGKVVVELFARNFNLMNADLTAVDEDAFQTFAESWVRFMNGVPPSWYPLALSATSAENLGQGGTPLPGAPGGMGGPPMGPGGGDGNPGAP